MDTSARLPTPICLGIRSRLFAAAIALAVFPSTASASDYAHSCRSADGAFTMQDEDLRSVDFATGQESGESIPYKTVARYDLRRTAGYCVSNDVPKGGSNQFAYLGTTYALQISFRHEGASLTLHMICDLASSGLPAAYNCDREVKTLDWTATPVAAPEPPAMPQPR